MNNNNMIYLDNAATTQVCEDAVDAAVSAMREGFYNPSATYKSGVATRERIESSRRNIAAAVGALPNELIFTSCATESNNWVFSCGIKNRKGNIVISAGEHASVYEPAMQLKSKGVDVRIAPLCADGTVDCDRLYQLVDENTALVSIIHVSNETGVINPIREISSTVRKIAPRAVIHSDGVQALLKCNAPINTLGLDYYSASAHKLGAPKGIGLLYVTKNVNISPLLHGGGQERALRSGTQNTPYIAAFEAAVKRFTNDKNRSENVSAIRSALAAHFISHGCNIVGTAENSGYILCVNIPGVKAEILQNIVHDRGVIIGKGAACAGSKRGNRVLSAMGLDAKQIECCIRISLFNDTNKTDALSAAQIITDAAQTIRSEHIG